MNNMDYLVPTKLYNDNTQVCFDTKYLRTKLSRNRNKWYNVDDFCKILGINPITLKDTDIYNLAKDGDDIYMSEKDFVFKVLEDNNQDELCERLLRHILDHKRNHLYVPKENISFYCSSMIEKFDKQGVIYYAYFGLDGEEPIYQYGGTNDIMKELDGLKQVAPKVEIITIKKTEKYKNICKKLENDLRNRQMLRENKYLKNTFTSTALYGLFNIFNVTDFLIMRED